MKVSQWRHRDFYIVTAVLSAKEFTFFATRKRGRQIALRGRGAALQRFLRTGSSAGWTLSGASSLELKIVGSGGPIMMSLAKVRRDGRVVRV